MFDELYLLPKVMPWIGRILETHQMWLGTRMREPLATFQFILRQFANGTLMRSPVWRMMRCFPARPLSVREVFENVFKWSKRNSCRVEINLTVHLQQKAQLLPCFPAANLCFTKLKS